MEKALDEGDRKLPVALTLGRQPTRGGMTVPPAPCMGPLLMQHFPLPFLLPLTPRALISSGCTQKTWHNASPAVACLSFLPLLLFLSHFQMNLDTGN